MNVNERTKTRWKYLRPLIATVLLVGGSFQIAKPILAQVVTPTPTPAGTEISNTATATYEDPNTPGIPINATSNTVVIQIAEVAGITVTPAGVPTDVNGGTVQPGDIVNYDFTVTNVGNDPTTIFIPGTATVTNGTPGTLQYSIDSGQTFTDVPAAGVTTDSIPVNGTVVVRVPVTVSLAATPNSQVSVVLGDTGPNDNSPATQNQPDATDTAGANEVRTIDNQGTTGGDASANPPANGEREASAVQSVTVGALADIVNGPNGQAGALGPDGTTNTDFTNASTTVPPGTPPGTPIDPAPTTITNTIQNNSATDPALVSLLPTPPTDPASLPDGTLVTITVSPTETATYSYNPATGFIYVSGQGTSPTDPPEFAPIPPGQPANYQVTIDLPANTPQLVGYPVPITAFIDNNGDGLPTAGEPANITIDRIFTGFLSLLKEARILAADATTELVPFTTDTALLSAQTAPGNIIEYRITYANVAPAVDLAATGSVNLTANNLVITENGTTNGNNWALDNNGDSLLDTINITGTAVDSRNGTIATTPAGDGPDVTQYVNTVGLVPSGETGTFIFRRRLQ